MTHFWETAFLDNGAMWGFEPTESAIYAKGLFTENGVSNILLPGFGYGRNAKVFIESGISVTGIEISETAIKLAKNVTPNVEIHHGSVLDMPYDEKQYDGIFCYALLHLLSQDERTKFITDCYKQLRPGGYMVFTTISKEAPMYGKGLKISDSYYEISDGLKMFFYDSESIDREFDGYGVVKVSTVIEPHKDNADKPAFSFLNIVCKKHS